MAKFNLLTEPWIPVLREGKVVEVGIGQALLEAHTITRIETPSPLEEAALHRLLLAVLYRAIPSAKEVYDVADLLEQGQFDPDPLNRYFAQYHDRFYLFHETAPFLQIGDLPQEDPRPWTTLVPQLASGNNPTLFDHSLDDSPKLISYAEAARALVLHQAFKTGGLLRRLEVVSAKDAPLARPAMFLVQGNNLFETLLLNLVPQSDMGQPIWERPPLRTQDVRGHATQWPLAGVSLVYAWPSRGVLLLDEGNGVRWTAYGPGVLPEDVAWIDPMVAIRKDKKGNILPLRLSVDRSFWRDFEAMLPASEGKWPAVMEHAGTVMELKGAGSILNVRVLGQVSDQDKILDIRREAYSFPKELLGGEAGATLLLALKIAEEVGSGLREVAWHLALGVLGRRDKRELDKREQHNSELQRFADSLPLLRLYWSQLDLKFPHFLAQIARGDALDSWRGAVRGAAVWAWEETRRFVGTEARHLKALTEANGVLGATLAKLGR